jgi:biopolymer transport protein ExbB
MRLPCVPAQAQYGQQFSTLSARMRFIMFFIVLFAIFVPAKDNKDNSSELEAQRYVLDSLAREVEALKKNRLEKANNLERAEAVRWQSRYAQSKATQEYQNETRILEGLYSKSSDNISRIAAELGAIRNLSSEQKDKAVAAQNNLDNFYLQVNQATDKSIEEISQDFPAKIEERLLNFANNKPGIEAYFQDKFNRLMLTETQEFTVKDSHRLRLGTVFFADIAPEQNADVKMVLRTGSLTGKVFEWRSSLAKNISEDVKRTILSAQQHADSAWIPMDVLQTKSVMGASLNTKEQTYSQKFFSWFNAGGIVMYPLFLVAFTALFLALERAFMLWQRGHISKTFINNLRSLVQNNQMEEAKKLCRKQKNCLGKILGAIVENFENGKSEAQKYTQGIIFSEQSKLEKRMGFLAALGTVAPLLGLLGTVTGMIALFQVITQVGTNDARILAGGISEALITTETGLIIAIPIMLFHGKLSETLDYIITEMKIQSLALFTLLWKEE